VKGNVRTTQDTWIILKNTLYYDAKYKYGGYSNISFIKGE